MGLAVSVASRGAPAEIPGLGRTSILPSACGGAWVRPAGTCELFCLSSSLAWLSGGDPSAAAHLITPNLFNPAR